MVGTPNHPYAQDHSNVQAATELLQNVVLFILCVLYICCDNPYAGQLEGVAYC